jgi:mono/diheme cytochrome c family protein
MFLKSRLVLGCLALSVGLGGLCPSLAGAASGLNVIWNVSAPEQELKTWDLGNLGKLKQVSTQEKDPVTGKLTHYKGVLLSHLLEQAMENLSPERKAQVDLVILRNSSGGQVLLPRSVIVRYPVLMALNAGKASIVMPWTSKPKLMREDLPVESYFVPELVSIELSNYRARYGSVYLKHRSDPLAIRGEKIFVQNCVGCHAGGAASKIPSISDLSGETKARRLASDGHPSQVKGVPHLSDRDRRALVNYLDAYRTENLPQTASPGAGKGSSQAALPATVSASR